MTQITDKQRLAAGEQGTSREIYRLIGNERPIGLKGMFNFFVNDYVSMRREDNDMLMSSYIYE